MEESGEIIQEVKEFNKKEMEYRIKSRELDKIKNTHTMTSVKVQEKEVSLMVFDAVSKFKSVWRAFRRGNISKYGHVFPGRPFNNRKDRPLEDKKRKIYESFKDYGRRTEARLAPQN